MSYTVGEDYDNRPYGPRGYYPGNDRKRQMLRQQATIERERKAERFDSPREAVTKSSLLNLLPDSYIITDDKIAKSRLSLKDFTTTQHRLSPKSATHPTISEDRSKDSRHEFEQAQLLVLQEKSQRRGQEYIERDPHAETRLLDRYAEAKATHTSWSMRGARKTEERTTDSRSRSRERAKYQAPIISVRDPRAIERDYRSVEEYEQYSWSSDDLSGRGSPRPLIPRLGLRQGSLSLLSTDLSDSRQDKFRQTHIQALSNDDSIGSSTTEPSHAGLRDPRFEAGSRSRKNGGRVRYDSRNSNAAPSSTIEYHHKYGASGHEDVRSFGIKEGLPEPGSALSNLTSPAQLDTPLGEDQQQGGQQQDDQQEADGCGANREKVRRGILKSSDPDTLIDSDLKDSTDLTVVIAEVGAQIALSQQKCKEECHTIVNEQIPFLLKCSTKPIFDTNSLHDGDRFESQSRGLKSQGRSRKSESGYSCRGCHLPWDGSSDLNAPSLERLQNEIAKYKEELALLKAARHQRWKPQWKFIYRVRALPAQIRDDGEDASSSIWEHWLDPPRWLRGDLGQRSLQGTLPLNDLKSYIHRHPELAFLVFRDYDPRKEEERGKATLHGPRRHRMHRDEEIPTSTSESISVVSEHLQQACGQIFEHLPYKPDSTRGRRNYKLDSPYLFIYHSRRSLADCVMGLSRPEAKSWDLLIKYIFAEFGSKYSQADDLLKRRVISDPFMQYLFRPNDFLVRCQDGQTKGYMSDSWLNVVSSSEGMSTMRENEKKKTGLFAKASQEDDEKLSGTKKTGWNLEAYTWHFNGSFYKIKETLEVSSTSDAREDIPITNLSVYPLQFAHATTRNLLERRGKTFWKCRNQCYVAYNAPGEEDAAKNMDARYMVDTKTYNKLHSGGAPIRYEQENAADEPPQKAILMLLPSEIKGYNLRTKKWVDLEVDRIVDISWNIAAFESLVTDDGTKELILALVTNQLAAEKATDLIGGKGNGLIMLLHGGPGTGKTFTAESVAEIAHKPLYRVTCGDIGTKPEEVEKYLESVLHLGKIWNCVVLLDEADIFLEERTLADLQRNALVSTFLRALEYYSGILILTSNRVGHFDEAFKSRIQLALHYKNLDQGQRHQIWWNFFRRLKNLKEEGVNFEDLDKHIDDLAKNEMNGRQIRNAITTARQLAIFRKRELDYRSLEDVIKTSSMFDKYLLELNEGNSDDVIARGMGNR